MSVGPRPLPDPVTRLVELLCWAALIAGTVLVLVRYPDLPDRVPTHFGVSGEPDSTGPAWAVWVLVAIWAGLQLGLSWLARRPHWHNYPVQVTDENRERLHDEGTRLMIWTEPGVAVLLAGAVVAITVTDRMTTWVVVLGLVLLALAMAVGVWRMLRAGRAGA